MISVSVAQRIVFEAIAKLQIENSEIVSLEKSRGLILNTDIFGERNQPPFHRVMMDGMAINFSEFEKSRKRKFKVESIARAGTPAHSLINKSNAIEVMTGAPLPVGCDCVIRYEDLIEEINGSETFQTIVDSVELSSFKNIHPLGSDYQKGDVILKSGSLIDSTIMAILASQGLKEVSVKLLPKVAIISTGDELVNPGEVILDHQIRRSNPFAIKSEIENFSSNVPVKLFHLNDEQESMKKILREVFKDYQLIIISGGVSKGKFDFIPETLKELGAVEHFHKVSQRPGKPLWFGTGKEDQIIFALPGNPVSSLVSTRRYIVPVLNYLLTKKENKPFQIRLKSDFEFSPSMTYFLPVVLDIEEGAVVGEPLVGNCSGDFSALASSSGFIELPSDVKQFKAGELFDYYRWSGKGALL